MKHELNANLALADRVDWVKRYAPTRAEMFRFAKRNKKSTFALQCAIAIAGFVLATVCGITISNLFV